MGFLTSLFGSPRKIPIAEVVGESHYQDELSKICGGRTEDGHDKIFDALLIPEDNNPADSKAVRVDILGRTVGHLSRENARQLRKKAQDEGIAKYALRVKARIRGGWYRGPDDQGFFGVTLDLPTTG
jgi:hypothetical protein